MNFGHRLKESQSKTVKADILNLWQADDVNTYGGKAGNLARINSLGLKVPKGFIISSQVFQKFLQKNNLRELIDSILKDLNRSDINSVKNASEIIRKRILESSLEDDRFVEELFRWRNEVLPEGPLVVRSSAIGEDSIKASFAGQLDSFLHIQSEEELKLGILQCWASYWSERSILYQFHKGTYLNGMVVIVQEQIKSHVSGVLFTIDPSEVNDCEASMRLEYCFGLADQLVSGNVQPGHIAISRSGFTWEEIDKPQQDERQNEQCDFNSTHYEELQNIGRILEKKLGGPQDIEWTLDEEGIIFVLQSRPITTGLGAREETPKVLWSNANINENFPEPITPFLYSFASEGYYHYFRNLGLSFGLNRQRVDDMEESLRNLIGVHGGRLYYNLTNVHRVLRSIPIGDRLVEAFNLFVGATQKSELEVQQSSLNKIQTILELVRVVGFTIEKYLFLSQRIKKFEGTIKNFSRDTHPNQLNRKSLQDLRNDLNGFLEIRFRRWNSAALADAAAMVTYWLLKSLLKKEFPESNQAALHNTLLKGLPNLVSNQPIIELWKLAQKIHADGALTTLFALPNSTEILKKVQDQEEFEPFKTAFEQYLEHWGFRRSGELMLTVPSFQETPWEVIKILKTYLKVEGNSPLEALKKLEQERVMETRQVLKSIDEKRIGIKAIAIKYFIKTILEWTHGAISLRERARLKQALLYSRVRQIALSIGRLMVKQGDLNLAEDIFFLTYQEIDSILSGSFMFPHQIKEWVEFRKKSHDELSRVIPPDSFELPEGNYYQEKQRTSTEPGVNNTNGTLSGEGACGGSITSRAIILDDVSQMDQISPGDILITRQTDPGWGPVFFLIKGLVIERGGMLSHGAILAREFGIPTVVGVKNAMELIPNYSTVMVDGDHGVVEIID